jgi:hypothetical protein
LILLTKFINPILLKGLLDLQPLVADGEADQNKNFKIILLAFLSQKKQVKIIFSVL